MNSLTLSDSVQNTVHCELAPFSQSVLHARSICSSSLILDTSSHNWSLLRHTKYTDKANVQNVQHESTRSTVAR